MASLLFILLLLSSSLHSSSSLADYSKGIWKVLKKSIGVSAMHMALLPNDRIITFDRTDFGPSNITFPAKKCPLGLDCYAHSVEFNPTKRGVRPLTILSDTWCSSGALLPNGVLIQSGGNNAGERVVRTFSPCEDCDWVETRNGLVSPRWYASNQLLPNGRVIVVGGRGQFTYEFIPKTSTSGLDFKEYSLPFLKETLRNDDFQNNLYPFLHLNTDGNLFIFANDRAILLDYVNNKVVRKYPAMPGGVSRNYPSTGSSVLLPMNLSGGGPVAEVFVCGGTVLDAVDKALGGEFVVGTKSCGRLRLNDEKPQWEMTEMPLNRIMGDMLLLHTGDVLIINGAARGAAGWDLAREPVLNPVLYEPGSKKFHKLNPTTIPRMYHSSCHLLSDGRVIVGGSNPNEKYNFSTLFPTELSVETFSPPYLLGPKLRPNITGIKPGVKLVYKQLIEVNFRLRGNGKEFDNGKVYATMMAPSFTTHSFSMNQRVLVLEVVEVRRRFTENYAMMCLAPAVAEVAPPGYYQLSIVYDGVPSRSNWVRIGT
ncbi:galactose oxidase/kelch, beta-propeller [Artemisia annua]|uniref:Galactose oxidase/kelch, beta-propeller n=1 Tax=Artemisia annua TaxID=35608 RepID=A0A2U1KL09_ARTAN|nr:galactose oxidase/kelch, beta-propeller [Artemisia annua]